MKTFNYKGLVFGLGRCTPRNNEFERGSKYELYVKCFDRAGETWRGCGVRFSSIQRGRAWVKDNYILYL